MDTSGIRKATSGCVCKVISRDNWRWDSNLRGRLTLKVGTIVQELRSPEWTNMKEEPVTVGSALSLFLGGCGVSCSPLPCLSDLILFLMTVPPNTEPGDHG